MTLDEYVDDILKPNIDKTKESHFRDAPYMDSCRDPQHNPPSHLWVPYGKEYVHICPSCGREIVLKSSQVGF